MNDVTMYDHTSGRHEPDDYGRIVPRSGYTIGYPDVKPGSRNMTERDLQHKANMLLYAAAPDLLKERDELRGLLREIVSAQPDFDDHRNDTYNIVVDKADYRRARELCGLEGE